MNDCYNQNRRSDTSKEKEEQNVWYMLVPQCYNQLAKHPYEPSSGLEVDHFQYVDKLPKFRNF